MYVPYYIGAFRKIEVSSSRSRLFVSNEQEREERGESSLVAI